MIASLSDRARTRRARSSTPCSSAISRTSSRASRARASSSSRDRVEGLGQGHLDHAQHPHLGLALLGQLHRGRQHLLADVAELERHQDGPHLVLGGRPPGRARRAWRAPAGSPLPPGARPGTRPRRSRATPARRCGPPPWVASDVTHSSAVRTAPTTDTTGIQAPRQRMLPGTRERPRQLGLARAQAHHGELGGGHRDQDAEAVEPGQEAGPVAERVGQHDQHRRDDRGGERGRAGRRRSALGPGEGVGQHVVAGHRVGQPLAAGHGGRHHRDQDEGLGHADRAPRYQAPPPGSSSPIAVAMPSRGACSHSVARPPATPSGAPGVGSTG